MAEYAATRIETDRLLLRPSLESDAVVHHELWSERDPRVPDHRRIDAHGHPDAQDIAEWLRIEPPAGLGLFEVVLKESGRSIGYCGLVGRGEPGVGAELAFELLRRAWNHGYATEASLAVLDWRRSLGHERLWATVWEWNLASRRVLEKAGFAEVDRVRDPAHGVNIVVSRVL